MQSATAHFSATNSNYVWPSTHTHTSPFVFLFGPARLRSSPRLLKREQPPIGDLLFKLMMIKCTFGEGLSSVHHDWTLGLGYTNPVPDECSTAGASFRCIAEHHVVGWRGCGANNAAEVEALPVAGHLRQVVR